MRYLAVLGQNPELSLVELQSVYPDIKIISRSNETAILESAQKIDIDRLGGTPKLGLYLGATDNLEKAKHIIIEGLMKLSAAKKVFFGLSFYGNSDRKKYERLGKEIKTALKDAGRKARWANSRELALSSVYIKTNKLLTRGFDFNLVFIPSSVIPAPPSVIPAKAGIQRSPIKSGITIMIFKTVAVQDFADYEFRDIRRPARDLVSGMTPPKLAKIMINLASPSFEKGRQGGIFLDPFCGSGTFLMEAALLDFKNICGSDISEKAVADSKKNIDWLIKNYQNKISPSLILPLSKGEEGGGVEIKLCDIKNISKCWSAGRRNKFSAIATEPYLGPPVRGALSAAQAEKMQKELSGLYETYLKNLAQVLESGGRLVLIIPFFITREKKFHLSLKIKEADLSAVRPSILYSRPDQKVGREIYVLKKMTKLQ